MAIGLNYADHIAESNMGTPEHQILVLQGADHPPTGRTIPSRYPKVSQALDYEGELVAVVGRGGRPHRQRRTPREAVFGYCCGNDATERAWQARTSQWVLGKSFDTHAPFGPWVRNRRRRSPTRMRSASAASVNGEVAAELQHPAPRVQRLGPDRGADAGS